MTSADSHEGAGGQEDPGPAILREGPVSTWWLHSAGCSWSCDYTGIRVLPPVLSRDFSRSQRDSELELLKQWSSLRKRDSLVIL